MKAPRMTDLGTPIFVFAMIAFFTIVFSAVAVVDRVLRWWKSVKPVR